MCRAVGRTSLKSCWPAPLSARPALPPPACGRDPPPRPPADRPGVREVHTSWRRSSSGGARQRGCSCSGGAVILRRRSGGPYLLQLQRLGLHAPQPPLSLPGGGQHLPLGQTGLFHLPLELLLLGLKEHEDMMYIHDVAIALCIDILFVYIMSFIYNMCIIYI